MAIRMSLVIVLTSSIGFWHVLENSKRQSLNTIEKYVTERGQRERLLFTIAESNHRAFKEDFLNRMESTKRKDFSGRFHQLVERTHEGVYRNRGPFDGRHQVGIYIGRQAQVTSEFMRKIVILHEMVGQYGPAWHNMFQDTYVMTPENAIVLYWPESPTWVSDIPEDFDMTTQEYFWVSNKTYNPSRKSAWTGMFFDSVAKVWLVSCETPVDEKGGAHIATIGHDMTVDEVIHRTVNDHLPETENIIFRGDGRLIAHSELWDAIKSKDGKYNVMDSQNTELHRLFELTKQHTQPVQVLEDSQLNSYIGVYHIPESDWYLATFYPRTIVNAAALEAALFVALLGIISLFLEICIVSWILRKQIAQPLKRMILAAQRMANGNLKIRLDMRRDDELGVLASSFDDMAAKLAVHEAKLSSQNAELGKQVQERTEELERERASAIHSTRLAVLGQMAGGIAHEINNPLAIVGLSSEQIAAVLEDVQLPPTKRMQVDKLISRIGMTVDRMAHIITGLRSFARDGSKDPFIVTPVYSIIEDTLVFCRMPIEKQKIKLMVDEFPEDLYIFCQPTQISQVLVNLLNNACDAVANLPEKWISLSWRVMGDRLRIAVTDSGSGIPTEIAEKIFLPFFTTKPAGKGTGIGLSVSYGIIENHSGSIELNLMSKNTQFVVELKLVDPSDEGIS